MFAPPASPRFAAEFKIRFHRRSLEHQRPLSTITMAFTVVAFLAFIGARGFVAGTPAPLAYRLACGAMLAALVAAIPRVRTTRGFGLIGVAYVCVLQIGAVLNVSGLPQPLLWLFPAALVIPVCAAPLWLTPRHFLAGTAAFYLTALPYLLSMQLRHDDWVLCVMWVVIGVPTSAVFNFGFYRFRRNHFLLEEKLAQIAATDPLTGLANRRAFLGEAAELLAHVDRYGGSVTAIFIDIDHFKSLNDQYGHATGDDALREVARTLRENVRPEDRTGRLGGEEFVVLSTTPGFDDALQGAEALRRAIATIRRPDGHLTASFGVARYRPGETPMELLDRADEALLRAKHAGRNRVFVESPNAVRRVRAASAPIARDPAPPLVTGPVDHTWRWGDYFLSSHFQPLYSLSHQKQVGFEALVRGTTEHGASISPALLFAPLGGNAASAGAADASGRDITALDRLTHDLHLTTGREVLPANAWLFLNVAPATFIHEDYPRQLEARVRALGFDPATIVLEILESQGGSVQELSRAAARYRERGFLIAVDDFGAGHSNLDRLLRIQPNFVKLDGELIRAKSRGTEQPILPNLVALLHHAGMLVVVEGIETTEELILAVQSNVDFAQGYLLGKPAAALVRSEAAGRRIDHAFDVIAESRVHRRTTFESQVEPYLLAIRGAAEALAQAVPVEAAFAPLAALDYCISCFLLDDTGRQIGVEIPGPSFLSDAPPLYPIADPREARWDNRPYFRRAVFAPGEPVASGPYLSLTSGRACVAVTLSAVIGERPIVLGAELDWTASRLSWPDTGNA